MQSIAGLSVGVALVAGFFIGKYGTVGLKNLVKKLTVSRRAAVGGGVAAGTGTISGVWYLGDFMPAGNCDLVLRSSSFKKGLPCLV